MRISVSASRWRRLGDAAGAVAAYDRATELLPSHAEAWFRAGALVFTMGHREEAIGCFRRAAATGPKTGFGRLGAARALLAEDRDAEAETALRRLLALEPGNAMAQDLLGNLLADAGRFDEARACFVRAVDAAPLMAGSYYDLVRCRRLTPDDRRDLAAHAGGAWRHLGWTVRKACGCILRSARPRTISANTNWRCGISMRQMPCAAAWLSFDAAAFDAQIDGMIARFTPALIERAAAMGSVDATPLLIIGMPRSGTTLVEQILSSHPEVTAGGELNFWNERGIAWLRRARRCRSGFSRPGGAGLLALLRAHRPEAPRVTDKMPFNFLWAGLIHLVFPARDDHSLPARRRSTRRCRSTRPISIRALAFPTGGAALVAYFRAYRRLTRHWRRVLPPDRFIEIDYEDLTAAPEPAIRRLVGGAAVYRWNEACLAPELNARVVKTPQQMAGAPADLSSCRASGGGATNPGSARLAHCATTRSVLRRAIGDRPLRDRTHRTATSCWCRRVGPPGTAIAS